MKGLAEDYLARVKTLYVPMKGKFNNLKKLVAFAHFC